MAPLPPRILFAEACGLPSEYLIPKQTAALLRHLSDFCARFNLEWGLEDGRDALFSLFIFNDPPNEKGWIVDMEANRVNDAIIQAVAVAWSNLHANRTTKIIDINEWRQK